MSAFRIIALILATVWPAVAVAQSHWQLLVENSRGGIRFYVDRARFEQIDGLLFTWLRVDYPTPLELDGKRYQSYDSRTSFDCDRRLEATYQLIYYSGPGGRGDVVFAFNDRGRQQKVPTADEDPDLILVLDLVCKLHAERTVVGGGPLAR